LYVIGEVSVWIVVSDAVERRFFNLVDGMMQSRDNPNPVTCPLNCVALEWWEPFSHHNGVVVMYDDGKAETGDCASMTTM
jgi:hypothetical protein